MLWEVCAYRVQGCLSYDWKLLPCPLLCSGLVTSSGDLYRVPGQAALT